MGYTEMSCLICGVRFNMARLRRTDEPLTAAWDIHRDSWRPGEDYDSAEEHPELIEAHRIDGQIVGYWYDGKYSAFHVEGQGIDPGSACEKAGCSEADGDHACGGPDCGFVLKGAKGNGDAYNGWHVSAEEMKLMTCVQVIMPNAHECDCPEELDDEYEAWSKQRCVLMELSESAPDEFDVKHVTRRLGFGGEEAVHICDGDYGDSEWGVPMHGPCWQILKMVAKTELPETWNLLDWLVTLRDCGGSDVLRRNMDVNDNNEQFWRHEPGTEYLAADPLNIPKLARLLDDCIKATQDAIDQDGFSNSLPLDDMVTQRDSFSLLPAELKLRVLDLLDFADVANLRLASRAWRQLPQSFFRDLISTRMPWIWEVRALPESSLVNWYTLYMKLFRSGARAIDEKRKTYQKYQDWNQIAERDGLYDFRSMKRSTHGEDNRINGLLNRRRIWNDARHVLNYIRLLCFFSSTQDATLDRQYY